MVAGVSTSSLTIPNSHSWERSEIPDFCHSSSVAAGMVVVVSVVDQVNEAAMVREVYHFGSWEAVKARLESEAATCLHRRFGIAGFGYIADFAVVRVEEGVAAVRLFLHFVMKSAEATPLTIVLQVSEAAAVEHLKMASLQVQDFPLSASAVIEAEEDLRQAAAADAAGLFVSGIAAVVLC